MLRKLTIGLAAAVLLLAVQAPLVAQDDPPTQSAATGLQQEPAPPAGSPATTGDVTAAPAPAEDQSSGLRQTATAVGSGVTSAARETATAVKQGGSEVAKQGRAVWTDVLTPMWQRLAGAVPGLLKALLVLLLFWILAVVLGAAVRKLLGLTRIDERAARDWGLGDLLKGKEGQTRSIERLAGTGVKWLILLFGLVAFFQALDLGMVAGPLQGIVDRIVGVIPNLLQAAVILLVYWVIASLLRLGVRRGLGAVGFDKRVSRFVPEREVEGKTVGASELVARLVFYVVLLFGLAPFLDALGQRALVTPLGDMLEKILAFLPNVVGAVVVFFLGHLVATVVREIVTNFLGATGLDAGAQRLGLKEFGDKLKLSEITGSVAYFFIIIPVLGAAVDSLQIRAISEPVTRTLETVLGAVPLVFTALVVLGIGYFLAKIVRRIVESFLKGVGVDILPEKLGLEFLKRENAALAPSAVLGTVVMVVILLLTAQQALATLRLHELADLVGGFIAYLPEVLVGLALLLAALSLSAYAARLVEGALGARAYGRTLAAVTRYAILFFGISLALHELGVGESLIAVALAAVLGGAALALGLAFGLGGRQRARQLIEGADQGGGS